MQEQNNNICVAILTGGLSSRMGGGIKSLEKFNNKTIKVLTFNTLTTSFSLKHNATIIFRGLRAVSDFEYEFQLAGMNKKLTKNIEKFLDSRAYIQIDLNKPKEMIEIIKNAIKNNEWEKRIDIIKKEKLKILNKLQLFPTIEKIIKIYL